MSIEYDKNKMFIPELIIDYLNKNKIDFIKSLPNGQDCTISDIISFCEHESKFYGKSGINFNLLIREAISNGYNKRYFSSCHQNEREMSKNEFLNAFFGILSQLELIDTYQKQNVIIVGIGNGYEGELLYSSIENISIVDIAPKSLDYAKSILPQSKAYNESADKLKSIEDSIFDLYISLRTYQCTYFDIASSLKEAKRILKKGGYIIISIACGYLNSQNEFEYGLVNPHSHIFEKDGPNRFLYRILNDLKQLGFEIVGTTKISTEIFVYAKNIKTKRLL